MPFCRLAIENDPTHKQPVEQLYKYICSNGWIRIHGELNRFRWQTDNDISSDKNSIENTAG